MSEQKETRLLSCPQCNPKLDDPDRITGFKDSLKYLVFGKKCKVCGTELIDLGVINEPQPINPQDKRES